MSKRQRSIMVAVRELNRSSAPLLRKAARLARSRRCDLLLVHVIALPYSPGLGRRAPLRDAANEIVNDCKERLQRLTASRELHGIRAEAVVSWDYPAAEGLVRQVIRWRPQLLLAESHRHAPLARPFLSNTDWDLIRQCPCPVWLSKAPRATLNGPVIAALDPLHAHAKPAALDAAILENAVMIAGGQPARVLACHAYTVPAPVVVDGAVEAYWIAMSKEETQRYEEMLRDKLNRLMDRHHVPPRNRRLVVGDPESVLPKIAKQNRAAVVVMGAVSRSGLSRVFIGHTAERVVDKLDCDVLIVKPRGFKTSVPPLPRPAVPLPPI